MNLSLTKRVKLLSYSLDEEKDLVIWEIFFLDNQTSQRFCWKTTDLVECFGLKISKIPIEVLEKFCKDMLNKEFNMQFNQTENAFPKKDISDEEYRKAIGSIYNSYNEWNEK